MDKKTLIVQLSIIAFILAGSIIFAEGKTVAKDVIYYDGGTALEGYVVYDSVKVQKEPGIIIVHEWNGLGKYVKSRAMKLAALGYTVFCADIYGKGARPVNMEESSKLSGIYKSDRKLMRSRINAAVAELKKLNIADNNRIAAIGYCFGGGVVLELARSGADIAGVVSFHGNLDAPVMAEEGAIKAKVLVLHGADDPYTSKEQVMKFQDEMRTAKADWQMDIYGGAVHGFTNPDNGSNTGTGAAYNKDADLRSWEAMKIFFMEIFAKHQGEE